MRAGYLGPPGTFSHEALGDGAEGVPFATLYDVVMAVQEGTVERALVPIENALEGSVDVTLDTLALEAPDVAIVGELVHPVRHCLVARELMSLREIQAVRSHPQASGQCARFIREHLPDATVLPAASTADAVRTLADGEAALGTHLAATLYGGVVLRAGVEDHPDNATRFVWLAPASGPPVEEADKTSLLFWGAGTDAAGWLVRCLSEFAFRGVSLTRIESRPRREGLGSYMFFLDLEGGADGGSVAEAIEALRAQTDHVRVLGSYRAGARATDTGVRAP
jgi:prephenate dehydratase